MSTTYPIISADSHITEPPDTTSTTSTRRSATGRRTWSTSSGAGDVFVIDGMKSPIPMGLVAAAGKPAEEIRLQGTRFADLHRGGWDPEARLADQERDGVAAEVIYPTVGMVLCNHRDFDYKKACFDAYNRWIAEYCAAHPDAPARRRPDRDALARGRHRRSRAIKALGLRGVMMPGNPVVEDYDSPVYDEFWEAAIELDLPLVVPHPDHARDARRRAARR